VTKVMELRAKKAPSIPANRAFVCGWKKKKRDIEPFSAQKIGTGLHVNVGGIGGAD